METACNLFHNNDTSRGQNYNFTSFAWDNNNNNINNNWELGTTSTASCTTTTTSDTNTSHYDLRHHLESYHHHSTTAPEILYGGSHAIYTGGVSGPHNHPDPHLMCLKLGKRNYFEDPNGRHVTGFSITKRGKPYYNGGGVVAEAVTVAIPATVPRCQVEGCHMALLNAKDYHRRHKVCEVHSKAPKVVVLGLEQRFCQQCSRFHLVTEFDDTKRSCRRRLAGHNERRRKNSQEHSTSTTVPRNNNPNSQGTFSSYLSSSGRALSLLSSRNESSISSSDLSSRCSAALRELIVENRAALLAKQYVFDKDWPIHHAMEDVSEQQNNPSSHLHHYHHPLVSGNGNHMFSEPQGWDRFDEPGTNNVTLDLMQAPTSAFQLLSMRGKSKEEEECSQLWSSFS